MSAEPQAGGSGRSAQTPRPDPSLTSNLEDVLRRAKEKDAAVAASAAGATYANGENSYRTDEADDAQSAAAEADDEDPSGTRER